MYHMHKKQAKASRVVCHCIGIATAFSCTMIMASLLCKYCYKRDKKQHAKDEGVGIIYSSSTFCTTRFLASSSCMYKQYLYQNHSKQGKKIEFFLKKPNIQATRSPIVLYLPYLPYDTWKSQYLFFDTSPRKFGNSIHLDLFCTAVPTRRYIPKVEVSLKSIIKNSKGVPSKQAKET